MNQLLEQIERAIRTRKLLSRGQKILVAVSGGLDSMVLLHVLHALSEKNGWQLTVAHFNHKLRGRSSDADERLVKLSAKKLQLDFISEKADVRDFAREHKLSIEMAARELRHEFLARTAARLKIPTMALAHHADDQVELFFLRLLRGSGGEGLSGMKWRNPSPANPKIGLARPLLEQSKSALREFARVRKIAFREDKTNASLDIRRNRIRNELLPLLKNKYQPAVVKTILRLMEIVGAESDFAGQAAQDWLEAKRKTLFAELPVAVQRRCVQYQLHRLNIQADFDLVEKLCAETNQSVSVSLKQAISRDAAGKVHLRESKSDKAGSLNSLTVELTTNSGAGEICFDDGEISWKLDSGNELPQRRAASTEFFDADKVGSTIILRHWQPGDRFQPIGMKQSVKLQDLFTNKKIPREQRSKSIVATTATGEIFWVEGLRISERFKLSDATTSRLKWNWRKI